MQSQPIKDAIEFAERCLTLLEQASTSTTYKYAVFIGLLDLMMEKTRNDGNAPDMVTTRELTVKIAEIYWPHALPFKNRVLKQSNKGQAEILSDIIQFKEHLGDVSITLERAKRLDEQGYRKLLDNIEWMLISMPLPRLQYVGNHDESFIYEINWDRSIEHQKRMINEYQAGKTGCFDNRVSLRNQVGNYLVMLNGLLRPMIYRRWSAMVVKLNKLEEQKLEDFLFNSNRVELNVIRPGLLQIQNNRCFYCDARMPGKAEVDHFIPWARYPDNSIDNLVAADTKCNLHKRDFLVSHDHLKKWVQRSKPDCFDAKMLADIAEHTKWEQHPVEILSVARSIYLHVRPGLSLWEHGDTFINADPGKLAEAFL